MLRTTSLAARLGFAAALTLVAAVHAAAQSADVDDQQRQSPAVEKAESEGGLFTAPGNPPSPQEEADRAEAEKGEKQPAEAPAARTAAPEAAPPSAPTEAATAVVDPVDPVIADVRQRLAAAKPADATAAEHAALTAFYADRKKPVWVVEGDFTDRARHVMAEIARADEWGLEAKAFAMPNAGDVLSTTALADTEIKLSVAVLKYARHARGGRLEPSQVSRNIDQKLSLRDPKVVLAAVAGTETPGSYLRDLHPKHPQFELLRQALLKVRAKGELGGREAEASVLLPSGGPALKLGVEHPDVALLRKRLKVAAAQGLETVFDEDLQQAVKAFQRKGGMRDDGVVGAGTRAALNGANRAPDRSKLYGTEEVRLIVNMERWRWLPEDMGEFHVWDNVPEFQARVIKNGRVVHQAKIVVGKVETQTTIFSANMRYIVFGPEWGVPDSIKVKDLLPKLQGSAGGGLFGWAFADTSILEAQNMRVVYRGRVIDPSQVDWSSVDIRKYSFIQAAGPKNALGAIKFRFPNKHDIYMHDTPLRDLFHKSVRAFSHGCVRVHEPGRLAEVLLEEDKGWPAARVREMMARGGNVEVTLTKTIPVHITYFTMVAAEDGTVSSFSDIYGHDQRVAAALAGRPLPLEAVQNLDAIAQDPAAASKKVRGAKRAPKQDDLFSALFGN